MAHLITLLVKSKTWRSQSNIETEQIDINEAQLSERLWSADYIREACLDQGSASYSLLAGSSLPNKIIQPAAPLQIVIVW